MVTGFLQRKQGCVHAGRESQLKERAEDGKTVWAEKSVYDYQSQYNGEIAIDTERGCLYVCNEKSIVAVKLYEE